MDSEPTEDRTRKPPLASRRLFDAEPEPVGCGQLFLAAMFGGGVLLFSVVLSAFPEVAGGNGDERRKANAFFTAFDFLVVIVTLFFVKRARRSGHMVLWFGLVFGFGISGLMNVWCSQQ